MNSFTFLLSVLVFTLVTGIIALIVLIARKKDNKRFEKVSALATFIASVGSIVIGIITVTVMKHQEEAELLHSQPLYSVHFELNYSQEKQKFDNQEYVLTNEGAKTRSKTDVHYNSIIEISYYNQEHGEVLTKYCPLDYYFGAAFTTGNLDGTIEYSAYSGNNNELFYDFYMEALRYSETHPGKSVAVKKTHYFTFEYTDIFGERHTVVKNENSEVDAEQFALILKKADLDCGGKSFSINHLNLEEILEICFKDEIR